MKNNHHPSTPQDIVQQYTHLCMRYLPCPVRSSCAQSVTYRRTTPWRLSTTTASAQALRPSSETKPLRSIAPPRPWADVVDEDAVAGAVEGVVVVLAGCNVSKPCVTAVCRSTFRTLAWKTTVPVAFALGMDVDVDVVVEVNVVEDKSEVNNGDTVDNTVALALPWSPLPLLVDAWRVAGAGVRVAFVVVEEVDEAREDRRRWSERAG